MSLDDAAHLIGLSKQSARKCVEELLVEGLVIQMGRRPLKIRSSESLKSVLALGIGGVLGSGGGNGKDGQ